MTQRNAPGSGIDALHCPIQAVRLPREGRSAFFEADEGQRFRLARQLGVVGIESLTADLLVRPWRADGAKVTGDVRAVVVQESVVTLEPLRRRVEEPIGLTFVPEGSKLATVHGTQSTELLIDPEGEDPPETFFGDAVDIGPYLAEAVSLGLDPYPREAGEDFEPVDTDPQPEAGRSSAFEALAELARKGKDENG